MNQASDRTAGRTADVTERESFSISLSFQHTGQGEAL